MKADPATFWAGLTGSALRSNAASTLQSHGIAKIWLDGQRHATLDHSVPQIGAPTAWAAGHTGTGVKVAVLDTGVGNTHPDTGAFPGNFVDGKVVQRMPAGRYLLSGSVSTDSANADDVIGAPNLRISKGLATVDVQLGKVSDPAYVWLTSMPHNDRDEWGYGQPFPVKAGVHKEFFGGDNVDWARRVSLPGQNFEDFEGPAKHYAPDRTYA